MKTLLVGINSQYIHSNLAIRYLKSYTKDLECKVKTKEFTINDYIPHILRGILEEKPEIVGFSTYIWNVEMVKKLSNLIKIVSPEIKILYGGPEVSFKSHDFLKNNQGDFIAEGEGEETFREFIIHINNNESLDGIKGLYYKKDGEVIYNGKRENMDMNNLVFPYDANEDLKNKIVYYEASRGCPYNCIYCLSSVDRNTRFKDMKIVKNELNYFLDKDVKLVKFVDRTYNTNPKFSSDIWKYLIEKGGHTCFHFEISAKLLRNEQMEILKKAPKGMFQLEVGVQTTNSDVLKNINRLDEFSIIKDKIKGVNKLKNIKQHVDLIAGLPGEDYSSFINSFNDVYSLGCEEVQLGFLKLLKGSQMYEETEKYGVKYSPYPPYEVLKTKDISYFELLKLKNVEKLVDKYYNSKKFTLSLNYMMKKFENPYSFYYEFSVYYKKMGYFDIPLSKDNYYKVLIDFYLYENGEDAAALNELLKFEYLKYNKKRGLPDFFHRNINKEENRSVKDFVLDKGLDKDAFIEKFNIDILSYINCKKIIKKQVFIVFDMKNGDSIYSVSNGDIYKI